jgi:hypothetical protein
MIRGDVPVFSGLYFTKSLPAEPLVYRGRGSGYFADWKMGDEVWVDGLPSGCTMFHRSIMEEMWKASEEYVVPQYGARTRRVYENPHTISQDPQSGTWTVTQGTEDLRLCDRIMDEKIFEKAGWPKYQAMEFPFLIDTNIFCYHIDENGLKYPLGGEEKKFEKEKKE